MAYVAIIAQLQGHRSKKWIQRKNNVFNRVNVPSVTTLFEVGVTASQLELPSQTPLPVAGYGRLQLVVSQ